LKRERERERMTHTEKDKETESQRKRISTVVESPHSRKFLSSVQIMKSHYGPGPHSTCPSTAV
jgi:hypothetical protein